MHCKCLATERKFWCKIHSIENQFINDHSDTFLITVKILKIGTPEIITIIVLQLEQLDFTVQNCVQKMQTE